ncbi:MAG: signal peptidase II [Deltaproteobacteria bacterium]|nr:signal peptidase II [Deltaproteobacteria bacterium]
MSDEKEPTPEATAEATAPAAPEAAPPAAPEATPPDAPKAAPPAKAVAKTGPAVTATPRDWVFLGVVAVVTAALDLWSKHWAFHNLSRPAMRVPPLCSPPPWAPTIDYLPQRSGTRVVELLRDHLEFSYAENCGGAWGLLHGAPELLRKPFFMLVTVGAMVFIVHLYRTLEKGQGLMRWALPLVLGGAIGNLVDRVRLGYVVDFIHGWARIAGRERHWPTFNVADIAITVGIGLMLLEYVVGPKPTSEKAPPAVPKTA